jgi:transposase-like protein
MTRSKLSDLEKQEIVSCFEQQQDTIPGLAERYQVSASTIRRLLKQSASESSPPAFNTATQPDIAQPNFEQKIDYPSVDNGAQPEATTESEPPTQKVIILDKKPKLILKSANAALTLGQDPAPSALVNEVESRSITPPPTLKSVREDLQANPDATSHHLWSSNSLDDNFNKIAALRAQEDSIRSLENEGTPSARPQLRPVTPPQEEMSAILADLGPRLTHPFADTGSEDEESEEFDDEDYDADEDDSEGFLLTEVMQLQPEVMLEVMPFTQAVLPKICYIVVDRTAELVTRPLKDFGDLGQIPADEVQSCTLPVFDNHRIARRFSHRTQRIIKVPNGNMLRSACTQLCAKGITRLLINGHIYALE